MNRILIILLIDECIYIHYYLLECKQSYWNCVLLCFVKYKYFEMSDTKSNKYQTKTHTLIALIQLKMNSYRQFQD